MVFLKGVLPTLLAIFLFANVVLSEDDSKADSWDEDKQCTIVNSKNQKSSLYTTGFWTGRFVRADRLSKPGKENKWVVTRVKLDGKSYFELMSVDSKTWIAPRGSKDLISANFKRYSKSKSTKSLWIMDPPKQNVPVTLKNMATKKNLREPYRGNKNVFSTLAPKPNGSSSAIERKS